MRRKGSRVVSCKDRFAVEKAKEVILSGGFVVAPSDTIYGIYADATNYQAVKRLKRLRRPSGRPFIVLLPDVSWAGKLGLSLKEFHLRILSLPGITIVLEKRSPLLYWLGTTTLAVRIPRRGFVIRLLKKIGRPLVAPSANREGEPPAENISRALQYFGDEVGLYVDCGVLKGQPSAVIDSKGKVLRRGRLSERTLKALQSSTTFPGLKRFLGSKRSFIPFKSS